MNALWSLVLLAIYLAIYPVWWCWRLARPCLLCGKRFRGFHQVCGPCYAAANAEPVPPEREALWTEHNRRQRGSP